MHKIQPRRVRTAVGKLPHLRLIHPLSTKAQAKPFTTDHSWGSPHTGEPVIDGIVHTLRNHLQTISLGFDLLALLKADMLECQRAMWEVERTCQLLQELRISHILSDDTLSTERLTDIVSSIARRVAREWEKPGQCLRIICPAQYVALRLDWRHLSKTLERVVNCTYALLPTTGGEVTIEADICENSHPQWIECNITATATTELRTEAQDLFQPSLQVNGYPVGLSLIVVEQTLSRYAGQVMYCQNDPSHICFTLLFPIQPRDEE